MQTQTNVGRKVEGLYIRRIYNLQGLDDKELMEAIKKGDYAAWGVVYERYYGPIYRFVRGMIDHDTAEDIAQNTLLRLRKKAYTFNPDSKSKVITWLYRIAKNLTLDELKYSQRKLRGEEEFRREQKISRELDDDGNFGIDIFTNSEDGVHSALRDRIYRLREDYRDVLMLQFYGGKNYKEMAEILQLPMNTVKVFRHRAIKRLRASKPLERMVSNL